VSNLEICAKLSTRAEVGYWILNYFPIKDAAGGVILVGKVAVEITDQKKVQQSLRSVTDNLIRNLLLTARDSDVLLRQIMGGSLRQVPSSGANRNRFAVRGLSNPPSVCSLDAMPPVSESGSEPDANAKLRAVALTAKEREVVKLLVKGNGNKGTAAILHISVKTVEAHRERIMLKLGLHSTKELMRHAISEKIVDPADF
jgi:DNA-binding CsgD family transcriptional regulator